MELWQKMFISTVSLHSPNIYKAINETESHPYITPVDRIIDDHLSKIKDLGGDNILESLGLPKIQKH